MHIENYFPAIQLGRALGVFVNRRGAQARGIQGIVDGIEPLRIFQSFGINKVVNTVVEQVNFKINILPVYAKSHIFFEAGFGSKGRVADFINYCAVVYAVCRAFRHVRRPPSPCDIGFYISCF